MTRSVEVGKAMTAYVAVTAPSTRVRKGLQRVLFAAECELDALRGKASYTASGMTRREYDNFKLATEWVRGLVPMSTGHTEIASAKIAEADACGSAWLARGNQYAERGRREQAERCYAKGQYWLDRSNKLRGNC